MKLNKLLLTALAGSLFFVSCNNDDDSGNQSSGIYDNGILVLNQGNFGTGNSSVSFVTDSLTIENNIFANNNGGMVMGDTGQDIGFNGDRAYIVLNNSGTIQVVNRYNFNHIATIEEGLINPRYIEFYQNKAYVTNWGDGSDANDDYVAVIDLSTNTVTATIAVAEGPEQIIEENNKLYVTHAGGYSQGNTLSVINPSTNTVQTTITTGDVPKFIDEEDNKIYVLSEGLPAWTGAETAGKLQVINASDNTVASTINFSAGQHPSNLLIEDDFIYYTIGASVYRMAINATSLPTQPLFTANGAFTYGIKSVEIEDNRIYIADEGDYVTNGVVYVFNMQGTLQATLEAGIGAFGLYAND